MRLALLALPLLAFVLADSPKAKDLPVVFQDDFEKGADRWEPTDPAGWKVVDLGGKRGKVFSQFMTVLKPVRDWIVGPWASQPKYPGSPLFYTHPVMHGDAVTQVKNELKRRHLNNPPMDGTDLFGSAADANVRKFQFAQHLVTDGVVGPRTWAALFPLS